jgi:transcription antitermination factor NusG
MMETKQEGNMMGRDTEVCGDPKIWFPMRVTYQREMKVKAELDRLGIECFVPMRYKVVELPLDKLRVRNGGDTELRRELVPAINNLIFVRSTKERISGLKASNEVLEPLRYMMDRTASREHAIMTVGDREMENFMRVASRTDDSVMFLDEETVVGKEGKRVEIMGGAFEGVTGVIRRVKRCKRVVVEIEGVASVAIAFVPAVMLRCVNNSF